MTRFIATLDISNGKAILVTHGKQTTILGDPMQLTREKLAILPTFQLVDIDAAQGTGNNRKVIREICARYPCYVGGGIRTYNDAVDILNASARRVIVSTAASKELFQKIGKERLILALDIDADYHVFSKGRTEMMRQDLFVLLDEYAEYVQKITVTFHHAEGTCAGIPIAQVHKINAYIREKSYHIELIVAGGITSVAEISELMKSGIVPQFGSGFWKGKFTLGDVYAACVDNVLKTDSKVGRLLPVVVQDFDGQILGLTYTDAMAIKVSVDTRVATFFSRERNLLWIKGATSGNKFHVLHVHFVCDGTALRMVVESDRLGGVFCHTGTESCFGDTDPARASLKSMSKMLSTRLSSTNKDSYSHMLLQDPSKLMNKVLEEALELVCATNTRDRVCETADLIYFVLMYLLQSGVDVSDVESELIRRRYAVKKSDYTIEIPFENRLKIGVFLNSKHNNDDYVFAYLESMFSCNISKASDNSRCLSYTASRDDIMIIPTKPKDVAVMINNGFLDAVVSYEDVICNYAANVEKIRITRNKPQDVKIIVACREGTTLDTLRTSAETRKLTIFSEYVRLTTEWCDRVNLKPKIVPVSGSAEGYLVQGICDMCVVVCDTGATLMANGLCILDTITVTGLNLFVHPDKMGMFESIIQNV